MVACWESARGWSFLPASVVRGGDGRITITTDGAGGRIPPRPVDPLTVCATTDGLLHWSAVGPLSTAERAVLCDLSNVARNTCYGAQPEDIVNHILDEQLDRARHPEREQRHDGQQTSPVCECKNDVTCQRCKDIIFDADVEQHAKRLRAAEHAVHTAPTAATASAQAVTSSSSSGGPAVGDGKDGAKISLGAAVVAAGLDRAIASAPAAGMTDCAEPSCLACFDARLLVYEAAANSSDGSSGSSGAQSGASASSGKKGAGRGKRKTRL